MSKSPTAQSICTLLKHALDQTDVLLTTDGRPRIVAMNDPSPADSRREARLAIDRYLDTATWLSPGPAFQQLREWVEVHWNSENDKSAPNGTIPTADDWPVQHELLLDAATATRKLLAAAQLYGPERIAKHALEFAAHRMIEVHRFWLLKGPPIEVAKPLDDYCTLLPYAEALRRIAAESDPGDLPTPWPESHAQSVCALQGRYFELASSQIDGYTQYTSPLLMHGPDQFALLLGLVWGSGFNVFGQWHDVPAAVAATLPYRLTRGPGAGSRSVALPMKGYGPLPQRRPLAVSELHALATSCSELTEQNRCRVQRAMARLRSRARRGRPRAGAVWSSAPAPLRDANVGEHVEADGPRSAPWRSQERPRPMMSRPSPRPSVASTI